MDSSHTWTPSATTVAGEKSLKTFWETLGTCLGTVDLGCEENTPVPRWARVALRALSPAPRLWGCAEEVPAGLPRQPGVEESRPGICGKSHRKARVKPTARPVSGNGPEGRVVSRGAP